VAIMATLRATAREIGHKGRSAGEGDTEDNGFGGRDLQYPQHEWAHR